MNLIGGCVKRQTKSDDIGAEVLEEFDVQNMKVVEIWMRCKAECSRLIFGQLTDLLNETAGGYLDRDMVIVGAREGRIWTVPGEYGSVGVSREIKSNSFLYRRDDEAPGRW
ncbi:hypothetical protein HG530_005590 [Fusarium avenaceum]|nr:hypothetical protein HG530_005590 [Fusarium avenaceum]